MLKIILIIMFIFFLKKFWLIKELIILIFCLFFIFLIPSFYILLRLIFFIDIISFRLLLLVLWIIFLIILAREKIKYIKNNGTLFLLVIIFLILFLILSFRVMNFFAFYLFFEMRLIPTLFLILGWGYQPERILAGIYLLFYTLLASLPLLVGIFYLYNNFIFLRFIIINLFLLLNSKILYFVILIAFLVKIPIFLVHLWLPKAHVEAPIAGSIILAGVLLKLGGYGLLRILRLLLKINNSYIHYWVSIRLMGGVLVRLRCLCQVDFKSLIAYSSIVHIGLILARIFNFSFWRFYRRLLIIISHGLCSSGLFYLANVSYERIINRRILISKGLLTLISSLRLWWFLLLSSNMAAPPSLNLISEIGLLNRIINWQNFSFIFLIILSFFRAAYCLYLFSYRQHGAIFSLVYSFSRNYIREFLILFLHWVPLNIIIIKVNLFFLWI